MHLPELTLYPGALGGLGCGECMGMRIHNWEVPVSETNIASELPEQHLDGSDGLFASRAFEIAVFDDDDTCVSRSENVIRICKSVDGIHRRRTCHTRPPGCRNGRCEFCEVLPIRRWYRRMVRFRSSVPTPLSNGCACSGLIRCLHASGRSQMKPKRIVGGSLLVAASCFAHMAQTQQAGVKRTELQRHDLSAP